MASDRLTNRAYPFRDHPTVKHAIESIGVPHPEVGRILAGGESVGFSHLLKNGDLVDVYPVCGYRLQRDSPLRRGYRGRPKFILDVHLGTLARRLRLLGFDSLYSNRFHDREIVGIASKEKRIILTRDIGMLMRSRVVYGSWIRSQDPEKQTAEVVDHFALRRWIAPFHRCTVCNGRIERINRESVRDMVKPEIWEFQREFYRCDTCDRIYWKGTHFERMEHVVGEYAGPT
jgi:uncharacterized protein with PIN domain